MQKIAADKVNIMECDPESALVTINFFQNLTQYITDVQIWPLFRDPKNIFQNNHPPPQKNNVAKMWTLKNKHFQQVLKD